MFLFFVFPFLLLLNLDILDIFYQGSILQHHSNKAEQDIKERVRKGNQDAKKLQGCLVLNRLYSIQQSIPFFSMHSSKHIPR